MYWMNGPGQEGNSKLLVSCTEGVRTESNDNSYRLTDRQTDRQTDTRQTLDSADFRNIVAQCHIFGGADPGGLSPQIRTRLRFSYNAPTPNPKFHPPMFTRSEIIVLTNTPTNKQTDAIENIQRSSLRYNAG